MIHPDELIKVGIMAAGRWPGVNEHTTIQRCRRNSVMLPIFESALGFDFSLYPFGRPPSEPIKQEEVVLETLGFDSGFTAHVGYSEGTNSLWYNGG